MKTSAVCTIPALPAMQIQYLKGMYGYGYGYGYKYGNFVGQGLDPHPLKLLCEYDTGPAPRGVEVDDDRNRPLLH